MCDIALARNLNSCHPYVEVLNFDIEDIEVLNFDIEVIDIKDTSILV